MRLPGVRGERTALPARGLWRQGAGPVSRQRAIGKHTCRKAGFIIDILFAEIGKT